MSADATGTAQAADALQQWFDEVVRLISRAVFDVAPEGPHRDAVVLNVLTGNARRLRDLDIDRGGALYNPLCLFLASACRWLRVHLGRGHWEAAVVNVVSLSQQLRGLHDASAGVGLEIGDPVRLLKGQMDEALLNAGVAGPPTFVDANGRRIAIGLAVNWGIRLLCAYALQSDAPTNPSCRDIGWIRDLLRPLSAPAAQAQP